MTSAKAQGHRHGKGCRVAFQYVMPAGENYTVDPAVERNFPKGWMRRVESRPYGRWRKHYLVKWWACPMTPEERQSELRGIEDEISRLEGLKARLEREEPQK